MYARLARAAVVTLTIGNSYSSITGLSLDQYKKLSIALSYTIQGAYGHFSLYGPRRKSLLSKRSEFPTGLLRYAYTFLEANKISWNTVENRFKPISQPLQSIFKEKPYPWQVEAVEAAIKHSRGIISAPTGTGKSMSIALLILKLNVKTLIVVPSLEIKRQMQEVLGSISNITVENIDSTNLKDLKDFDCLIIDEAHHVAAKTYHKLNKTAWTGIYHRYFFTATPFRNEKEETMLFEAIAGEVIYRLDYKTAVEAKYIVPIEAYYIEVPKQQTEAFLYAQVYKELVVDNIIRNAAITKLINILQVANKSTLCLVREIEHGKTLSMLSNIPFVSGEDDNSKDYIREFNSGELKCLIGTTGIIGEGIDTKPCEYVIIAGLGKAKSQFIQQIGRALRRYPDKESAKIIIIKDSSHKFTARHFNSQRAILKQEYGIICKKLEV